MRPRTSQEIVDQIIALNGTCTQREVARRFNLSQTAISRICIRLGIKWKWQRRDQFGANNSQYINGLGKSTIERLTRRLVIASGRDLFLCERCNARNPFQEQVRHHKDRNRTNNENNNIEVLCQHCHVTEHNADRERDQETGRFTA